MEPLGEDRRRPGPRQLEHGVEGVIQGAPPGTLQGLVHGVFSGFLGPRLGFCATSGKSGLVGALYGDLPLTKSSKVASWPFPKRTGVGTYRPHPTAFARVAFSGSLRTELSAPQALAISVSAFGFSG